MKPWAALWCLLAWVPPLAAQSLRGTLVEEQSGRPVAGALVQLLADSDRIAASTSSNEQGRFALPQVSPGGYRVRVLRIGFRPWVSVPFALTADVMPEQTFRVPAVPIVLADITVEASSPCRGSPVEDARMALLWDEARTSLGLVGAAAGRDLQFRLTITRRMVDPWGHLQQENRWSSVGQGAWPVTSQAPDSLIQAGFVQPRDTLFGPVYFGPDVAVFFSDAFLRTHCFRLIPPPRKTPELLGLGFEPVKGRPVPDIRGVLWLGRTGARLRRLEYQYTGLWSWVPTGSAGGALEFDRLGDGQPIIAAWSIRAPVAATGPHIPGERRDPSTRPFFGNARVVLHGFREEQGLVEDVRVAGGRLLWQRGEGATPHTPTIPSESER